MASICGRLLLLGAVRLRFIWDFLDVMVSMTPGGCIGVLHLFSPFSFLVPLPAYIDFGNVLGRSTDLGCRLLCEPFSGGGELIALFSVISGLPCGISCDFGNWSLEFSMPTLAGICGCSVLASSASREDF